MKIGIIGAGKIGTTLARKLSAGGHSIRIANSRGPDSIKALAAEVGATAVSVPEAVKDVDVVIVSIPQKRVADLPKDLFADVPVGVVVVDTGNYFPAHRDGPIEAIESGQPESLWVSEQLGRPVVKAFNDIIADSLARRGRPSGAEGRIALSVSGDDARAKGVVIGLLDELGFDGIDAGGLADSWRSQPGMAAYCLDLNTEELRRALTSEDRTGAPERRNRAVLEIGKIGAAATGEDIRKVLRSQLET